MMAPLPILRHLAPSIKRAMVISTTTVASAGALFFWGILPEKRVIQKTQEENQELNTRLTQMRTDVANTEQQQKETDQAKAQRDTLTNEGVIEPLLGSFAMRAKMLLDPIAQRNGLQIDSVRELTPITLQLPKPAPEQIHYRQPIEFSGQGSYAQIAAFIAQVEEENPLTILSGLLILGQTQNVERHKVVMSFEWPARSEKNKTAPSPQK